jgi:putative membrane protein
MPELSGPLAQHMTIHVLAMSVAAPLLVLWRQPSEKAVPPMMGLALSVQILLLYGWHIPTVTAFAAQSWFLSLLMHISLFLSALYFWRCVVDASSDRPWVALGGLLLAAKLFCLMGVLLTFAPRPLYLEMFWLCLPTGSALSPLADQQSAGLLMLIACPLIYIAAATYVVARWLAEVDRRAAGAGWPLASHD